MILKRFAPLVSLALSFGACEKVVPPPPPEPPREALFSSANAVGKEVFVNGTLLSPAAIDRATVYVVGRMWLERKIVSALLTEEIQSRISEGADPASFQVLDEEIDRQILQSRAEFASKSPGVDYDENLKAFGLNEAELREQIAVSLAFERLFLPADPKDWPEITKQIIHAKGGGAFLDGLEKNAASSEKRELPEILKKSFGQWVLEELKKVSKIKYASGGIPSDCVLTVNGRPLRTSEGIEALRPGPWSRSRAIRWLGKATLLQQELEREGFWLSDAETEKRYAEYRAPYEKSIFPFEAVVLSVKQFPTMEVYQTFFRLIESYRKKIAAEINDENLRRHLEKAQDFLGGGTVEAHVILCSAWDFATNLPLSETSWDEAWNQAARRAAKVKQRLDKQEDFDALLDELSEFPEKLSNPAATEKQQWKRGRFQALYKNELKGMLGENDFETFLWGSSIADRAFAAKAGEIFGPVKGPYGYYLVKIVRHSPGKRALSLENESQRQLVEEDYLNERFLAWADERMSKAEIEIRPLE